MNQKKMTWTHGEIRTRVMSLVTTVCADESCPILPALDQCVDDAIDSFWPNPVGKWVPVLAFRDVQQCIRQGFCPSRTMMS